MLSALLRRDKRLDVTDATADPIRVIFESRPQVAVISLQQDNAPQGGFRLLHSIRSSSPKTRSIMVLDTPHRESVVKAFRSGARGVISRCESLALLLKCIKRVHENQLWANSQLLEFVVDALTETPACNLTNVNGDPLLSSREREVVSFVAAGFSNKDVARAMNLSDHTIRNYIFHIFNKLGISNRVELVLYATSQRASEAGENRCVEPKAMLGEVQRKPPNADHYADMPVDKVANDCIPGAD